MIGFIDSYGFTIDGNIIRNGRNIDVLNGSVTLRLPDRDVTGLAAKFFVIARTRMLRLEDLDNIQVFFNDGNENNFEITNLEYFFAPALKCHIHRGFYVIPKATCYAIDESGKLINRMNGVEKTWRTTNTIPEKNITGGYKVSHCFGDIKNKINISRHRVLLLTLNPPKTNPALLWVNHKNGIPGSDSLDNLEWVTPGENNKHAYRTGLTTKALVPVSVKDIVTGIVTSYSSIQLCVEALGITHTAITGRLVKPDVVFEGKQFKRDDGTAWTEVIRISDGKPPNVKLACRDIVTGVICIFETVDEAERITGHARQHIRNHAKSMRIKPLGRYNFRLLNQESWFPNHHKNSVQTYLRYPLRAPVGVISDDDKVYFDSLGDLARHLEINEDAAYASFKAKRLIGGVLWKSFIHEDNLGEPIYLELKHYGPL